MSLIFIPSLLVASLLTSIGHATPLLAGFDKGSRRDPASVGAQTFNLNVAPVPIPGAKEFPKEQLVSLPVAAEVTEIVDWGMNEKCYLPEFAMLNVTAFSSNDKIHGKLLWPPVVATPATVAKRCQYRQLANEKNECPEGGEPKVKVCSNGSTVIIDFKSVVDATGKKIDPSAIANMIKQALMRSVEK